MRWIGEGGGVMDEKGRGNLVYIGYFYELGFDEWGFEY